MTVGLAMSIVAVLFAAMAVVALFVFGFVVLAESHPFVGHAAFFAFLYALCVAVVYIFGGSSS